MRTPSLSSVCGTEPIHIKVSNNNMVASRVTTSTNENARKNNSMPITRICCIGAGYVGGPTCAVIAKYNPNVAVTIVDLSASRIEAWKSDQLPIHEPQLFEIVKSTRDNHSDRKANLFFSTDIDTAIREAELIFVSVNTPTKITSRGKGRAPELSYVESAIRRIAAVSTSSKIIVEKSTVPVRTAESMRAILSANSKPGVEFDILSNPEFLAEGTAITDLVSPDRILIGSLNTESGLRAARALAGIYEAWVPQERIVHTNVWSSELAKLAANCLLAQRISSINALSAICEMTGADVSEVAYVCGLDSRIGTKMLNASVGFGGSCFKKDVLALSYIAESLHLPEVASYWRNINDINEYQKERFAKRIVACLNHSLHQKRIAVLGFTYKKDTGDTRESASISVICDLIAEGAHVAVYDPQATEASIWHELEAAVGDATLVQGHVTIHNHAHEACAGAHAVAILTEWEEFKNSRLNSISSLTPPQTPPPFSSAAPRRTDLDDTRNEMEARREIDWKHIASIMQKPMYVFDGRNILDVKGLEELGFNVESIGKSRAGWNGPT